MPTDGRKMLRSHGGVLSSSPQEWDGLAANLFANSQKDSWRCAVSLARGKLEASLQGVKSDRWWRGERERCAVIRGIDKCPQQGLSRGSSRVNGACLQGFGDVHFGGVEVRKGEAIC